MDIETRVRTYEKELSETDRDIIAYILNNKESIMDMGVSELSQKVHVSNSSIVRLTKKLHFKGFTEMRFYLAQSYKEEQNIIHDEVNSLKLQRQDLEQTNRLIQQTDFSMIIEAMDEAETIYCYGTGFSQKISLSELSQFMMYKNKRMLSFPAKREFDMNMPLITRKDLVIIISLTGETNEIKENVDMLHLRKIPLLSITNLAKNYIADKATYNLFYTATPFYLSKGRENEIHSFITLNLVMDTLIRKYFDYTM